jgi:hypothetical protein
MIKKTCFLLGLAISSLALGQVPQLINYQGVLTDGYGNPVDGTRSIQFTIYNTPTEGTPLWSESQTVTVQKGLFGVLLGSVTPIPYSVFEGAKNYLALKVGSDPEMSPRKRLVSVVYSFKAGNADHFAGKDTSDFIRAGQDTSISNNMLKENSVTVERILPNIVSSVDGVVNDGGNIDLVAGDNITITPNNAEKSIQISVSGTGGGGNTLDQAYDQGGPGAGRILTADAGAVRIAGNDGLLVDGNVGIGTASPQTKLDVSGTVTATAFKGNGNQLTGVETGDWYGSHPPSVSGDLWRTGNVGVGVSNPSARLDLVAEDANGNGPTTVLELSHFANPPANGIASRIQMITSSAPGTYRDAAYIDAVMSSLSTETSALAFWTRKAGVMGERVRIDGSGNMGIGVSNPGFKLDVNGTVNATAFKGDGSQLTNVETGDWYGSHPPSPNGNLWRGGNVGVGVSNPTSKLDLVAEDANGNGPTTVLELSHFANPPANGIASRIQMITSSAPGTYRDAAYIDAVMSSLSTETSALAFWTRNAGSMGERVRITGSGKVGIGTANPIGLLDVNGSIYQRGAQLHADYVFEPDYRLESIEDHSDFMWRNRHLKAIPKAARDDEGNEILEIGSQNRGIVEELEKAHIYITKLNSRINELEKKIQQIESGKSGGR